MEEVRGRMLEDIILLETAKTLDKKRYRVFKLKFERGEFDMVIYDRQDNCCEIYEIKHSDQIVEEQARHLRDSDKCMRAQRRFGEIAKKCVLYLGCETEMGEVLYYNAESFLKELPGFCGKKY